MVTRRAAGELVGPADTAHQPKVDVSIGGAILGIQSRQILGQDQIGLAGIGAPAIGLVCPDDQIIQPIAIHIPRRGDGKARLVTRRAAGELIGKAHTAHQPEVDVSIRDAIRRIRRRQIGGKDQIGLARIGAPTIDTACPDDQIIQPIAIHIPRRGDRPAS